MTNIRFARVVAALLSLAPIACASAPTTVSPSASPAPRAAAAGPVSLGPPVLVGTGGIDGFMTTGPDGTIHLVHGGRYRSGPAPERLGPEERITDLDPVSTIRMTVAANGQPHVVFTAGQMAKATRSYYTTRKDGRWLAVEKFADVAELLDRSRAYVADVAVDEHGNVLVAFWVSRPGERRRFLEEPSFYYRWRTPDGTWSASKSLPASWSSTPKVEYQPGRGFYLLWQRDKVHWRVAGPVEAKADFSEQQSESTGSDGLTGTTEIQNEGPDFAVGGGARIAVAGNVRETFWGPIGVWASVKQGAAFKAAYLGGFPQTTRGAESGVQPVVAWDAATGSVLLVVKNPADNRAYGAVFEPDRGWLSDPSWPLGRYFPLLPDRDAPQGTLRQGPSVADRPGSGLLVLVRDGKENWYLREVLLAPTR